MEMLKFTAIKPNNQYRPKKVSRNHFVTKKVYFGGQRGKEDAAASQPTNECCSLFTA